MKKLFVLATIATLLMPLSVFAERSVDTDVHDIRDDMKLAMMGGGQAAGMMNGGQGSSMMKGGQGSGMMEQGNTMQDKEKPNGMNMDQMMLRMKNMEKRMDMMEMMMKQMMKSQ